jgi:hypothetical protein
MPQGRPSGRSYTCRQNRPLQRVDKPTPSGGHRRDHIKTNQIRRRGRVSKEIYQVIDRDGVLRERSAGDMTKDETIKDIIGGEFSSVAFVLCINIEESSCRDVSEDIAHEVLNRAPDPLRGPALDFVEDRIGVAAAQEAGL